MNFGSHLMASFNSAKINFRLGRNHDIDLNSAKARFRSRLSIGKQSVPQICMQKGPLFEAAGNGSARPGGAGRLRSPGARGGVRQGLSMWRDF